MPRPNRRIGAGNLSSTRERVLVVLCVRLHRVPGTTTGGPTRRALIRLADDGSGLDRGRDGCFDLGELFGRAELDQLGAFLRFGCMPGRHVESVTGPQDLLMVVVTDDDSSLDDVAPVGAGALAGREGGQYGRQVVGLGDRHEVDREPAELAGSVERDPEVLHPVSGSA